MSHPSLPIHAAIAAASFCILGAVAAHAGPCGDVDGDGTVAVTDALMVLKQSTGAAIDLRCDNPSAASDADLEARVAALEALLASAELVGDTIVFSGVNVQIVDGSGSTDGGGTEECRKDKDCPDNAHCTDFGRCVLGDGVGNLIIGYNEADADDLKIGSHTVIIGARHTYTGYGAIVAGEDNEVGEAAAGVTGGRGNAAVADYASVTGGIDNVAEGEKSVIAGGNSNTTFSEDSSILGGTFNLATGFSSAVCGGRRNRANGFASAILGGFENEARGPSSSITGGDFNFATALHAVVVGGRDNVAGGTSSVVLGAKGFTTRSEIDLIPSDRWAR